MVTWTRLGWSKATGYVLQHSHYGSCKANHACQALPAVCFEPWPANHTFITDQYGNLLDISAASDLYMCRAVQHQNHQRHGDCADCQSLSPIEEETPALLH